jgi:primosomal protein N''
MNLLKQIRNKRTRKRKKQRFDREIFTQISTLVRWHALDENFLNKLDNVEDYPPAEKMDFVQVKTKKPFDFPLFSLCSRDEYDLTRAILRKVNTPYLSFAHSPEEILLSGILYRMNAELQPEKLIRYDFETLVLYEHAKMYLKDSANQAAEVDTTPDIGCETEIIENKKSKCITSTEHIKLLHNFIAKVESAAS